MLREILKKKKMSPPSLCWADHALALLPLPAHQGAYASGRAVDRGRMAAVHGDSFLRCPGSALHGKRSDGWLLAERRALESECQGASRSDGLYCRTEEPQFCLGNRRRGAVARPSASRRDIACQPWKRGLDRRTRFARAPLFATECPVSL